MAHPGATGEFSALMAHIGVVGKMVAQDLRRAGLNNVLGTTGAINVQGEAVKKLDELANDTFLKVFHSSGLVCALASEEMDIDSPIVRRRPRIAQSCETRYNRRQ